MKENGIGGYNTKTGLVFEGKTNLANFLNQQKNYRVIDDKVFYENILVALIFKKHKLYKFLEHKNIN